MIHHLIAAVLLGVAASFPTPPVQTDVQTAVIRAQTLKAKTASEAATEQVKTIFDSKSFRAGLHDCCKEIAALSSDELLLRFRAEVKSAELAHSFPSGFEAASHFSDITIPLAAKYNWFLNEWQVPIVANEKAELLYNLAEENIFGCPPFKNDSKPTWKESADRMIYIAHNMKQLDTGSLPFFGDVSAIFRKPYVRDMVLIAAMDTGMWESACNKSAIAPNKFHLNLTCSAWSPTTVGTLDYFDHVILSSWGLWASNFNTTIEEQAVKLFARSALSDGGYLDIPKTNLMDAMTYYEANILGNPRFPDGVAFLLGNFYTLFGTDAGRELQLLADQYSWPLVWALGTDVKPASLRSKTATDESIVLERFNASFPKPTLYGGNQRLLDPEVVGSRALNATFGKGARDAFVQVWTQVAKRRRNPLPILPRQWNEWWASLTTSQVRLAPISARSGCSEEMCIGTMAVSEECVCAKGKTTIVV